MPFIKMKKDQSGSINGYEVKQFKAGKIYNIPANLANIFVNTLKVAKIVEMETPKVETAVEIAPENKAIEMVPESKDEYTDDDTQANAQEFASLSVMRRLGHMNNNKKGNKKGKK